MSQVFGVVVGVVQDNKDPQGWGRVRVEFPWMGGTNKGWWAPVATLMSGGDRGSWFMPEKGDEVLVAFDHGEVNHPFIVGYVWNGVDKPPSKDVKLRRLKTVSGHILEFDDNEGKERILLTTQGGHFLEMKDTEGTIEIKTKGAHQIEMNDPSGSVTITTKGSQKVEMRDTPASISIQTAGGQKIALNDMPGSITAELSGGQKKISLDQTGATVQTSPTNQVMLTDAGIIVNAPSGMVSVTCSLATINATSVLSITAPMTTFSGVVQASTLIASTVISSSVISAAYTPGAGNLFGL